MAPVTGLLDQHVETPEHADLGCVAPKDGIKSCLGPFFVFPEYRTIYPSVVTTALGNLYVEYNRSFDPLVWANREWETDYQHCVALDGSSVNYFVQIDMVGLPQEFLSAAAGMPEDVVGHVLRKRIFEIENSLAVYQVVQGIFSFPSQDSYFKKKFRACLDELRQRYARPIALLAVTKQKHEAMRQSEFGKITGESLTDAEVFDLSGFDGLFGPEDFCDYLARKKGKCEYLLYVRSSDTVDKLKKPEVEVEHPLLSDPDIRKTIKAHALTFNIDAPGMDYFRRINDTKEYMPPMGMAYPVRFQTDIFSAEFAAHLSQGKGDGSKTYKDYSGDRISPKFTAYLQGEGLASEDVASGEVILRGKPMKGAYGCYGHVSGTLTEQKFRKEFRSNLHKRGPYVIQPEMQMPVIINKTDGQAYAYIDRNFFAYTDGQPRFLGGFRSFMPMDSIEAQKGRIHGNSSTVWAEII